MFAWKYQTSRVRMPLSETFVVHSRILSRFWVILLSWSFCRKTLGQRSHDIKIEMKDHIMYKEKKYLKDWYDEIISCQKWSVGFSEEFNKFWKIRINQVIKVRTERVIFFNNCMGKHYLKNCSPFAWSTSLKGFSLLSDKSLLLCVAKLFLAKKDLESGGIISTIGCSGRPIPFRDKELVLFEGTL